MSEDASDRNDLSVTELLSRIDAGEETAGHELLARVYHELRSLARGVLRQKAGNHTLQPTILVHDAWLRLAGSGAPRDFTGRQHFFSVAAKAMRQLVIDHARRSRASKRGGDLDWRRVTLHDAVDPSSSQEAGVLALHEALERLEQLDERLARIVELRFFGGLTVEETGAALGLPERKMKELWRVARAWLRRELD